jgi:hypothetical protein
MVSHLRLMSSALDDTCQDHAAQSRAPAALRGSPQRVSKGSFASQARKLLRYIVSAAVPVDGAHWIDTGEGRSQRVLPSADQNPPTAARATRAKPRTLRLSGQARNSKEHLS